jgi:hypothetical protein
MLRNGNIWILGDTGGNRSHSTFDATGLSYVLQQAYYDGNQVEVENREQMKSSTTVVWVSSLQSSL